MSFFMNGDTALPWPRPASSGGQPLLIQILVTLVAIIHLA